MFGKHQRQLSGRGQDSSWFLVLLRFGLLVLLSCSWLLAGCERSPVEQAGLQTETQQEQVSRQVLLYFADADGSRLVAEQRLIDNCADESACVKAVVAALAAGPQDTAAAVLPKTAVLNALAMDGSLASLDFNAEFINAHPGGTRSELLTIYALADTLAANFPHLRQFSFLVDGAPIETIKGHVDLRQPITPDFSLVEEESAAAGDLSNVPARSE